MPGRLRSWPPLRRYSSVSIANHIRSCSRVEVAAASTSAALPPCLAAFAAPSTVMPMPPQAERLS